MSNREIAESAAIDLCRELYDRFLMGGWEPQDAHEQTKSIILRAIEESRREPTANETDDLKERVYKKFGTMGDLEGITRVARWAIEEKSNV